MTETEEIIKYLNRLDPHHAPCDPSRWKISDRVVVGLDGNLFEIMMYDDKHVVGSLTQEPHDITCFEMLERLAELVPRVAKKLAEPIE